MRVYYFSVHRGVNDLAIKSSSCIPSIINCCHKNARRRQEKGGESSGYKISEPSLKNQNRLSLDKEWRRIIRDAGIRKDF